MSAKNSIIQVGCWIQMNATVYHVSVFKMTYILHSNKFVLKYIFPVKLFITMDIAY